MWEILGGSLGFETDSLGPFLIERRRQKTLSRAARPVFKRSAVEDPAMIPLKCFVIMPFEFDSVFEVVQQAVSGAVPGERIDCHWLKEVHAAGRINEDILSSLHETDLTVADVSGCNPNVMWETGYAMALEKPSILIAQNLGELPFDLKLHRVISYNLSALSEIANPLASAVRQTLGKYELKRGSPFVGRATPEQKAIVVTGSSVADIPRTRHRLDTLLQPYMHSGVVWFCGSEGTVDELAVEYLLSHGEQVIAVAYHRYGFSKAVREQIEAGKVQFIDASVEPVPRGMEGPSSREILFYRKADLVVLLWDGASRGTRQLIDYFQGKGSSTLVGLI